MNDIELSCVKDNVKYGFTCSEDYYNRYIKDLDHDNFVDFMVRYGDIIDDCVMDWDDYWEREFYYKYGWV